MIRGIVLLVCILFCNIIFSQSLSNDESYLDNDFWKFKVRLANCTIKKDKEELKDLLSDKVLDCWDAFDCAGPDGCNKEQFINTFFNDKQSKHWDILQRTIQFGFSRILDTTNYKNINTTRDSLVFEAPSFSKKSFREDASKVIILAENLNLRAKPSINSEIITKVSYGVYNCKTDESESTVIYFQDNIEWIKISLKNGTTGYISKKFTSKYLDRTIRVAKIKGKWKLIMYYCNINL